MLRRLVLALLLTAGSAAAQTAGERIGQPALPGFTQVVQEQGGGNAIAEWVPRGETILQWTRMVTVQRFGGLAASVLPAPYLDRIRANLLQAACPSATTSPITELTVSGRPAAQFRVDCPMNPRTGAPETFFLRAIGGARDMHVVQIAFRRRPTAQDVAFAQQHLAGVALCGPASTEPVCRAS